MLNTPVALLIFRRPELTARVLAAIRQARPRRLFVVADGPRPDRPDDVEACAVTRAVIDHVDWDCEVTKNYADVNLKCGWRVASGITWVFEHVEEAIILEDDCVPDPSFFRFSQELLERYREDERIMHIAGCTYRRETWPIPSSYYFSCFNGAWGWATWRRAWKYFDLGIKLWPELRNTSWLEDVLEDEIAVQAWASEFDSAYELVGDVTWDHQWTFACWANSGLSIVPKHNLVSNVGCGKDATHTFDENDPTGNLPVAKMTFPLVHPPVILQDRDLDRRAVRESILPRLPQPAAKTNPLRLLASRIAPEFVKRGYRMLASACSTRVTRSFMKAVILAGDLGTRISEESGITPISFFPL
jgi:hypothetical protein